MLLKKTSYPTESELVICTVSKIMPSSVFVNLDEYGNRSAMIHIAEIAPGRIRNIREYVIEGKKVICKVLNVNREKGYIDLSLRRVSETMRRAKADEIKQEQKAEKILEYIARELKKKPEEVSQELLPKIALKYETLYSAFEDIAQGTLDLKEIGVEKTIAEKVTSVVVEKIVPETVFVEGTVAVSTYDKNGVEIIHSAFKKAEETEDTHIMYLGAGTFKIKVTAKDYKSAEKTLKTITDYAIDTMEKTGGTAIFKRIEN